MRDMKGKAAMPTAPAQVGQPDDPPKHAGDEALSQRYGKELHAATDDGLSGSDRARADYADAGQAERESVNTETPAAPIVVTADSARGALGPEKTSAGGTLLPMLIGGLVLAVVSLTAVMMIG